MTAGHCIYGTQPVEVRFADGAEHGADVVARDPVTEQVILRLTEPFSGAPLEVAPAPPARGAVLYFMGNFEPDEPSWQRVRVKRIGPCTMLPRLRDALFTTARGRVGDSGAALIDTQGRIVGLIHGGTQCNIATPVYRLRALMERLMPAELVPQGSGST